MVSCFLPDPLCLWVPFYLFILFYYFSCQGGRLTLVRGGENRPQKDHPLSFWLPPPSRTAFPALGMGKTLYTERPIGRWCAAYTWAKYCDWTACMHIRDISPPSDSHSFVLPPGPAPRIIGLTTLWRNGNWKHNGTRDIVITSEKLPDLT